MENKKEFVSQIPDGRQTVENRGNGKQRGITGNRAARIAATVLFGLFLFAAGVMACIRPVCTRVIHEAFLGRSVALRANDVIWEWFQTDDIDLAIQIQQAVENHKQLERIASAYLDALADTTGTAAKFVRPDVSGELAALNEDIIRMLESEFGQKLHEAGRQSMMEELREAENQVIEILDELPYFIGNFGRYAQLALRLYHILTSWWTFSIALIILALLGLGMYRAEGQKAEILWHMAFPFLVDGALLGILLSWGLEKAAYQITNRVIGRAQEIDVSPLRYLGILFGGIAFALMLAHFIGKKRARAAEMKGEERCATGN